MKIPVRHALRDLAEPGIQGRDGARRPGMAYEIALERAVLAGQHMAAIRRQPQAFGEDRLVLGIVRVHDGRDRHHGRQVGRRHGAPARFA